MKKIHVKNTYNINLSGKPSDTLKEVNGSTQVAVTPSAIDLIKPKLVVKEGDQVQIGSPLFYDKQNPDIFYLSPGAGTISAINYGPKRRLDEVVISLDREETSVDFGQISKEGLASLSQENVVKKLQVGGVWTSFKQFPFKNVPRPSVLPPSIIVSLDDDEPYLPKSSVLLQNREDDFVFGLEILKKLTDNLVVAISETNNAVKSKLGNVITHEVSGEYPANNPGVILYYTKKTSAENGAWTITCQDVLRIASLFKTGAYPIEKIITIAGDLVIDPCHVKTREGVSVKQVLGDFVEKVPVRYISGGIFSGKTVSKSGYIAGTDQSLHLIREGKEPEMLTFFRPGFDKPTFSKTYLSALLKKDAWSMTTNINGGYRSCISCSECPRVCPVGIYPQLLMKSIYAKEVEETLELGLLDCADCGLCTYVCPSKIDLDAMFRDEKHRLAKEVI